MAEANATATPAAASAAPALTLDQIKAEIAAAIAPITGAIKSLGDNQKAIADTLAADAAKAAEAAKAKPADKTDATAAGKPLTAEDVAKLVAEKLDAAQRAQATTAQSAAAKNAFVAEKLKGVPAVYAAKLGDDPSKWAAEEQQIRESLKADLTALGAKIPDVAGGNPGGATGSSAAAAGTPASLKAAGLSDGEAAFATALKLPA